MMELFVNVSNETGSVIISAAGGKQSALEGEAVKINGKKIENGAFTYSVLEYLQADRRNTNSQWPQELCRKKSRGDHQR